MCGIAGYITRDGKRPAVTKNQLSKMLLKAQVRGKMATGIFWTGEKENNVFKLPVDAKTFSPLVPWENVLRADVCLMHTRHATQGNPEENTNNHPLQEGNLILIHNGVIHNSNDYVSNQITDSFAITEAYFEHKGINDTFAMGLKKALKHLTGSIACAMFDTEEDRLLLVRAGNPLAIGLKKNTLFFASTKSILDAVKPEAVFIAPENYMYSIKKNHLKGYKIKKKEVDYGENKEIEWRDFPSRFGALNY